MIKTTSRSLVFAVAGLALAASATAANFSVSGSGGPIPDTNATPGTWNVIGGYTGTPFTSSVAVANPVTSITAVKLQGFTHSWRGDLHIILKDPSGAAYNVVVRPGSTGGAAVGDGGNYNLGDYSFVTSGGGTVAQGATNIAPGTYNQFFNTGTGQWTAGISNTPLTSITGAAGNWTLEIRDWAALDTGSLTGWTLEGTDGGGSGITSYCGAGDANLTTPCSSFGSGATGNGCANSGNPSGASLTATGSPTADTVVMTQTGELATSTSIFLQGTANIPAGISFGDGVRCAGGTLKRLYVKSAVGGTVSAPTGGDPSIQTQSATLGDPIAPGSTRYYQVYYRDPASATGANFNVGNALAMQY
jgi:subtilisin-like proprotein convertase family protein